MKSFLIASLCLLALPALAGEPATELHGFADASYFHDANAKAGEFGLDQAEIDITHRASEKTVVRADVEWLKDGDDFQAQVEQAYLAYTCNGGATFTLGRFNAPIGFELVDPNEMYQYSHSLVFTYGLPVNLTGAMVQKDLGAGVDLRAYGVNGWDINAETNKVLTWGGRAGYTRGAFSGGVSAISGKEVSLEVNSVEIEGEMQDVTVEIPFDRTVFDVDLAWKPAGWVVGGEVNAGTVKADDHDANWLAFLAMAHHDVNDWFGLTVRYDRFDDQDGVVFGPIGDKTQVRQSFTAAPTFVLDDGFGALVEFRLDTSDQDAFTDNDGKPTDSALTMAFEMTYSW